jgi:EpsI family protein
MAVALRSIVVEPQREAQFEPIPLNVGQWQGRDIPIDESTAATLKATSALMRAYRHPDGTYLTLFLAYFRDQKYGSQIHSPRHCLPGGGWVVANLERVPFDLGDKHLTVNRMIITRREQVDQMFYWFVTRSGQLTSEYALKFDLVWNSLLLRPTDAAMIRVTVNRQGRSAEECQEIAEWFLRSIKDEIDRSLPFEKVVDEAEALHFSDPPDPVA